MVEIYSGVCWPHMNGYVLSKKIFQEGYYWLTMERDSIRFVLKSHQCQVHGDLIHSPPAELHAMSTSWSFVAWGMDVIGPIKPKTSNGHRFILVAIDYFTNLFKIAHQNSTLYRPKANGAVEAANKNIKKILWKMVQGSRKCHEKLPFALLGYRTTVHTSIGETPYLLVYETEAVIPAKVKIPTLRVIVEAEIHNDELVKTQLEQLSLIDEKRLTSVCHGQLYHKRMARAYNKKVRPRNFKVGQLVLKHILHHQVEAKGKFCPNWKSPFIVNKVLPNGASYLTDIEGKMVEMTINADAIKRYYV
ncbi:hypothetical protein CQW23_00106 [Capsicum baccatum]|uniref:Integrase catalytic domain-containing protein n=1 Tax=Capsicum baccatum TaxID=33114 RepID=A0A2G2XJR7_CAPBA|nr:hypothetical protein CQW23_00106 [Capsicum baccatum]